MNEEIIPVVRLTAGTSFSGFLESLLIALLERYETSSLSWEEKDSKAYFTIYCADIPSRTAIVAGIHELKNEYAALFEGLDIIVEDLKREDWSELWKANFMHRQVSKRIGIVPSWQADACENYPIAIMIDPGMSFGTGLHGTTVACINFLDELADDFQGASLCDMGCGSGILSIAAEKLGFSPICAFDYDPIAVEAAQENVSINKCQNVTVSQDDINLYSPPTQFDLVVANIESHILKKGSQTISNALSHKKDARLILSGILDMEYAAVADWFCQALDLEELASKAINEWRSGLFKRRLS